MKRQPVYFFRALPAVFFFAGLFAFFLAVFRAMGLRAGLAAFRLALGFFVFCRFARLHVLAIYFRLSEADNFNSFVCSGRIDFADLAALESNRSPAVNTRAAGR